MGDGRSLPDEEQGGCNMKVIGTTIAEDTRSLAGRINGEVSERSVRRHGGLHGAIRGRGLLGGPASQSAPRARRLGRRANRSSEERHR